MSNALGKELSSADRAPGSSPNPSLTIETDKSSGCWITAPTRNVCSVLIKSPKARLLCLWSANTSLVFITHFCFIAAGPVSSATTWLSGRRLPKACQGSLKGIIKEAGGIKWFEEEIRGNSWLGLPAWWSLGLQWKRILQPPQIIDVFNGNAGLGWIPQASSKIFTHRHEI